MLQVVYLPNSSIKKIEKFIVISDLDELLNFIKYNKIKLLSIPVSEDALDVLDCILQNDIKIKTIHIQQYENIVQRIKLFFIFAKAYSDREIKLNITLKHEYLDGVLQKNKKED